MTDLHVKGAFNSAAGTLKGVVGRLTGDRTLEAKGTVQHVEGKVQGGLADVGDAARDAVKEMTKDMAPDAPPEAAEARDAPDAAPIPETTPARAAERGPADPVPTEAATEAEGA